jgi:hypothetical protein
VTAFHRVLGVQVVSAEQQERWESGTNIPSKISMGSFEVMETVTSLPSRDPTFGAEMAKK